MGQGATHFSVPDTEDGRVQCGGEDRHFLSLGLGGSEGHRDLIHGAEELLQLQLDMSEITMRLL